MTEDSYERKYKLIDAAYEKMFKILGEAKLIVSSHNHDPHEPLPKDQRLINAVTVTLENICLFGELILHLPDISYRVLHSKYEPNDIDSKKTHWRDLINWALAYSKNFYDRIVDKKSQQLLWLFEQEINPSKRTAEFMNPYRHQSDREHLKAEQKKKPPKKLKKGPRLAGGRDEL